MQILLPSQFLCLFLFGGRLAVSERHRNRQIKPVVKESITKYRETLSYFEINKNFKVLFTARLFICGCWKQVLQQFKLT
jgi:hypothetical protein